MFTIDTFNLGSPLGEKSGLTVRGHLESSERALNRASSTSSKGRLDFRCDAQNTKPAVRQVIECPAARRRDRLRRSPDGGPQEVTEKSPSPSTYLWAMIPHL
jgi:hypothetical protein